MQSYSRPQVRSRSRAVRAAVSTALESLETRRLFAYAVTDTIESPDFGNYDPDVADIVLATKGNLALIGKPSDADFMGTALLVDTSLPEGSNVVQTFPNPGGGLSLFGWAVAFVGDRFAISAPDEFGFDAPRVYIYDDAADNLPDEVINLPAGYDALGGFGRTLAALDDNTLLVGQPFAISGEGIVTAFDADTGVVIKNANDVPMTFESDYDGDQIGDGMASNGSRVLLSTKSPEGTRVLEFDTAQFDPAGKPLRLRTITLPAITGGVRNSLALAYGTGGEVIVGDYNQSQVHVYAAYDPVTHPTTGDVLNRTVAGEDGSLFGANLAVRGNDVLVTAEGSGSAYVFTYTDNSPVEVFSYAGTPASDTDPASPASRAGFGVDAGTTAAGFLIGEFSLGNVVVDRLHVVTYVVPTGPTAPTAVLNNGTVTVTGSGEGETILVRVVNGSLEVIVDGNATPLAAFNTGAVSQVIVHGGAGDDAITSASSNTFPTQIFGGDGNDTITGGGGEDLLFGETGNDLIYAANGNDVAVGGYGNDQLFGGNGRDVLIGGKGSDTLEGQNGEDILVGGYTLKDADPAALANIRAIWISGHTYSARVATLANDLLGTASVFDDDEPDLLAGGRGQDWLVVIGDEDTVS